MDDAPGAATPLPSWRVERILFDEAGLLVVDKPIGMPIYGGEEALDHSVVKRLGCWLESEGRDDYLGVHQRLDQETSGTLLFVSDKSRNADVAQAMESRSLTRKYLAVVTLNRAGQARGERKWAHEGRSELWLRHDKGRTAVSSSGSNAKRAVTHYRILRREGVRALVELSLETGRTHQIRATLAHLGAPIVGDKLYGGEPAWRMMLHASELSGGPLPRCLRAPVPGCFETALRGEEAEFPSDFRQSLLDAASLRAPLLNQSSTFRLVNGVGDGLPGMTVDAYGRFATLNIYEAGPATKILEIAQTLLNLGYRGVYEKKRVRADLRGQDAEALAPEGARLGQNAPASFVVEEFGMQLNIELADGLSTGLFVDMRDNRFVARKWCRAGRVLNLFCYTSSFSVSAALTGAHTTNVDLSGKALERGRANFVANALDPSKHRFFKEDAMKFLARAVRRGEKYDFIVLDPPSFSTVGKGTFSVKAGYGQAAADCLRLLGKGGRLLCVTNHTKTSPRAFRGMVEEAGQAAGRKLRYVKTLAAGLDCPPSPHGPWPSKSLIVEVD